MFVACTVLSILLSVTLVASGAAKLIRATRVVETLTGIGVPLGWFSWLATAEFAGGVGLILGLAVAPLGVAAAIGVVLYFIGAVITHLRAKDYKGVGAPAVLLIFAIVALALRIATL